MELTVEKPEATISHTVQSQTVQPDQSPYFLSTNIFSLQDALKSGQQLPEPDPNAVELDHIIVEGPAQKTIGESEAEKRTRIENIRSINQNAVHLMFSFSEEEIVEGDNFEIPTELVTELIRQTDTAPFIGEPIQRKSRKQKKEEPWENHKLKMPFLEDIRRKIWRHPDKVRLIGEIELRGMTHLRGTRLVGYIYMLIHARTTSRTVFSKLRILDIKDVNLKSFGLTTYSEYVVIRLDGSEYTFTEADFSVLDPQDVEDLYHLYRKFTLSKDKTYSEGFYAIK